jgi:hypothetical protein
MREAGWLSGNLASIVTGVVLCGAIGAAGYFVSNLGDSKPTQKQIQQVTLVKPPAPPPPPPPEKTKAVEEEKTPEPEMIKPLDAVKPLPPLPDLPPPPGPLGLDAEGTGPGDAYGLAGQPGGRALGEGGSGGGGGGSGPATWKWYSNAVQSEFIEALGNNEKTRYADFARTQLAVWATPEGRISKVRLYRSTGDPAVDAAIEQEIPRLVVLRQPPPKDMPLPIRFYLNPRAQKQG